MTLYEWLYERRACKRGLVASKSKTYEQAIADCHRGDFLCFILDKIYEEECSAAGIPTKEVWDRYHWRTFLTTLFGEGVAFLAHRELFYIYRGWDSYHRSSGNTEYFGNWKKATDEVFICMPDKIQGVD